MIVREIACDQNVASKIKSLCHVSKSEKCNRL